MKLLDRLPIPTRDTLGFVGDDSIRLKEAEIIVWVSLTNIKAEHLSLGAARIPAILDTGHTHNFAIQEQHLRRWVRIPPEELRLLGHVRHAGRRIPLHAAKLWLHHNQPGTVTPSTDRFLLNLPRGIAVYPHGENYPRLPLLGLRAILSNNLHLTIDGQKTCVTLRTSTWKTRLAGWLT